MGCRKFPRVRSCPLRSPRRLHARHDREHAIDGEKHLGDRFSGAVDRKASRHFQQSATPAISAIPLSLTCRRIALPWISSRVSLLCRAGNPARFGPFVDSRRHARRGFCPYWARTIFSCLKPHRDILHLGGRLYLAQQDGSLHLQLLTRAGTCIIPLQGASDIVPPRNALGAWPAVSTIPTRVPQTRPAR